MKQVWKISLLKWSIGLGAVPLAWAATYTVRRGDTLSAISRSLLSGPTYGPHGNLQKLLAANPHIKNPDVIRTGEAIEIPAQSVAQVETPDAAVRLPASEEPPAQTPPPVTHPLESYLKLHSGFAFTKLKAEESSSHAAANLNSQTHAALALGYLTRWSPTLESEVGLRMARLKFKGFTGGSASLEEDTVVTKDVQVHLRKTFGDRWRGEVALAYGQKPFLSAESSTEFAVTTLNRLRVGVAGDYVFLREQNTQLGATLGADVLGGGTEGEAKASAGYAANASLYMQQDFKNYSLQLNLKFNHERQRIAELRQIQTDFGLGVTISFPLGSSRSQ